MENLFLVCLIPPASIVEDIDAIRNDISDKYKVYVSLKRPAHITLYNPVKISSLEKEKIFFKALENAAFSESFSQIILNFNSFAPNTVYIDVDKNSHIMQLQAQIKLALKPLDLLPEKNNFKFNPHLTIAFKDIKPVTYPLIMQEYKGKNFKREFLVDRFSVYKHVDKRWQPFREFLFNNPNDKPKPLSLFD
ncbi:2'-5' RNA ligase family protein [Pedobacter jamesrossensis]|uniref:2'-5' RNA ligase family protein n=1 Tax=Pedobacter jamesrossensis TaxID=1908238 RepID=A0ABV8NN66_9SPHI